MNQQLKYYHNMSMAEKLYMLGDEVEDVYAPEDKIDYELLNEDIKKLMKEKKVKESMDLIQCMVYPLAIPQVGRYFAKIYLQNM